MYVYMGNYVKIKKTIYQKNRKDSLRTLFVEIPSYKRAVDRICPAKSDFIPANQLLFIKSQPHLHLIYPHNSSSACI